MKNKANHIATYILLISVCLPVNAAKYSFEERLQQENTKLDQDQDQDDFFYGNKKEFEQNQEQLILSLIKERKLSEARKKLASLIQKNPTQTSLYNLQGLLYLLDKNTELAEKSFNKILELDINNEAANLSLAKLALKNKRFDQAKQYANNVIINNKYEINAYKILAAISMEQQGIDLVEKTLLDAYKNVKGKLTIEIKILKLLEKVFITLNQQDKLRPLVVDLVERNQGDTAALSYLVDVQLNSQDLIGVEKSLRQIITQEPKDVKHRFILARLLSKRDGSEAEVLELLDESALKIEKPIIILMYKTAFLIKQEKYQQAFSIAKQLEESYPSIEVGKVLKGDIYLAEKKYGEALENYKDAYQITPNTKILGAMLKTWAIQNKYEDSINFLKKELEKNKDNVEIQFKLAGAYQDLKQFDLSINHYETLIAKHGKGNNIIILNNLAWAYAQTGNKKGLELAKKAYKKAPKSAVVVDTYGYILLKSGGLKDGLILLKQAVKLAPNKGNIKLHLAEAYIANKDKLKAKEILNELISQNGLEKSVANKLLGDL